MDGLAACRKSVLLSLSAIETNLLVHSAFFGYWGALNNVDASVLLA